MPWIPDVVTQTVIASTWGNTVRDHTVARFASRAAMAAQAAPDGMLALCVDDRSTWERRAGAWYPLITNYRTWTRAFFWGSISAPDTSTVISDSAVYATMRRVGANVEVQYQGALTSGPYGGGVVLWVAVPQAANNGDTLGSLRLFNNRTGQAHGPWPLWAGSKPIVFAGGTVQVPFVTVGEFGGQFYLRESTADTAYTLAMRLWYSTDNLTDTPWVIP